MKDWVWLYFVVGAFLSWGCYVPVLHEGQTEIGRTAGGNPKLFAKNGALRAFLCVGLAYFVTAVLIPAVVIAMTPGEQFGMSLKGFSYSFLGGALGAAGALCIIFAMRNGGTPQWVPPLVFSGAPIINAMVSLWWHPPAVKPGPLYFAGIVLAAVGAGMVLFEKASADKRSAELKTSAAQAAAEAAPPA